MSPRQAIGYLSLLLVMGLVIIAVSQIEVRTWLPANWPRTITLLTGACGLYGIAVSLKLVLWNREQPSRRVVDSRYTKVVRV
jgi:hypothetical protein